MISQKIPLSLWFFFSVLATISATPSVKIALLYTNESSHSPLAFRRAISEINTDPDILPETVLEEIAINIGSDNDNPALATHQMCTLLEEDDVVAIITPLTSAQTKSCSYIAGQIGLPIISPTATDPNLNNPIWAGTLARLSPSNQRQAGAILDLMATFGWRRVAIVYTSDPYGVTLAEAVKELMLDRGLDLLTEIEIYYDVADKVHSETSRSWIVELQNSATRVTLLLTQPDYAEVVLRAAQSWGMVGGQYAWVASTAVTEATLFAFDDKSELKIYYDGLIGISPYLDVTGGFYRRLKEFYRLNGFNLLTPTDGLVYDAVYLIANSLDKVYRENGDLINNFAGKCYEETPRKEWDLGVQIFRTFTTTKYTGIAGHRQMWPTGQPDPETVRYNIVNFSRTTNNITRVGVWEPRRKPAVTLSQQPVWYGGETKVPADNPELESSVLKLGVLEDKPFVIYNYTKQGYKSCADMPNRDWCYTGVSIEIVKRLQERLMFEYEFVEPPDGKFGSEVDGVWNGIINQVRLQDIDIGVVGFGTSHGRERVVDFGISFLPGGVRMAMSKEPTSKDFFFFLRPFSGGVWIAILVGMILFFLAIYFLDYYSPYGHAGGVRFKCRLCKCEQCDRLIMKRGGFREKVCPFEEDHQLKHQMGIMSPPNALWLSVCSFLTYAPADGVPKNWSGRIVISVWWMICLVLVSMYTANLAAFLTVSRISVDINSVDDLLTQREYLFGTVEGTVTENLLRHSDSVALRSVFKRTNQSNSFSDAIDKMQNTKYIFIYGTGPLEYTSSTEHCDIQLIGDVLVHFGYAFAFQIDSPYLEAFNREMLVMQEKGTIKDLWNQFVKGSCKEDHEFDAEADSLEVGSLLGILIISIPLFVIGLIVFGLEVYVSPKGRTGKKLKKEQSPKQHDISFLKNHGKLWHHVFSVVVFTCGVMSAFSGIALDTTWLISFGFTCIFWGTLYLLHSLEMGPEVPPNTRLVLNQELEEIMRLDEESFELTTTQSIPPVSLDLDGA